MLLSLAIRVDSDRSYRPPRIRRKRVVNTPPIFLEAVVTRRIGIVEWEDPPGRGTWKYLRHRVAAVLASRGQGCGTCWKTAATIYCGPWKGYEPGALYRLRARLRAIRFESRTGIGSSEELALHMWRVGQYLDAEPTERPATPRELDLRGRGGRRRAYEAWTAQQAEEIDRPLPASRAAGDHGLLYAVTGPDDVDVATAVDDVAAFLDHLRNEPEPESHVSKHVSLRQYWKEGMESFARQELADVQFEMLAERLKNRGGEQFFWQELHELTRGAARVVRRASEEGLQPDEWDRRLRANARRVLAYWLRKEFGDGTLTAEQIRGLE